MGLAIQPELEELDAAARAHLDDPRTIVIPGFLSWHEAASRPAGIPPAAEGASAALHVRVACGAPRRRTGRMIFGRLWAA